MPFHQPQATGLQAAPSFPPTVEPAGPAGAGLGLLPFS